MFLPQKKETKKNNKQQQQQNREHNKHWNVLDTSFTFMMMMVSWGYVYMQTHQMYILNISHSLFIDDTSVKLFFFLMNGEKAEISNNIYKKLQIVKKKRQQDKFEHRLCFF